MKYGSILMGVLGAQIIHASAHAESCPALPPNTALPLTVGPFSVKAAPGAKTGAYGAIDLLNDVIITFTNADVSVARTTLELSTTWIKPINVRVVANYKGRTSFTATYVISKDKNIVQFEVPTANAESVVIAQSGAESSLVSLCAASGN